MRCIYGHAPGTCDCMLTKDEVSAARENLRKNNAAAHAARAALRVAPRRLEQRLLERTQQKLDELEANEDGPDFPSERTPRQSKAVAVASRDALQTKPQFLEQRLFDRAQEKISRRANRTGVMQSPASEDQRMDFGILFIFMMALTFLAIINIMLRFG